MRIEQLLRPVEAYLNSRMAIIRAMDERALPINDLTEKLAMSYATLTRRRQNSAHWRPSELENLATLLSIPREPISGLRSVASQMMILPESVRGQLYKEARLDSHKLRQRHTDYNYWQYVEVERLAATLRTWQDSKKMDTLLANTLKQATTQLSVPQSTNTHPEAPVNSSSELLSMDASDLSGHQPIAATMGYCQVAAPFVQLAFTNGILAAEPSIH